MGDARRTRSRLLGLGGLGGLRLGDGVLRRATLAGHDQLALIGQRLELRRELAQRQRLELVRAGNECGMQFTARLLHAGQLGDDAIVKFAEVFLFSCHSHSPWFGCYRSTISLTRAE